MTISQRPLGRSGLTVAPLAFGGNVFGWSVKDAAGTAKLLDAFVDGGFNLIDTADVYPAWVPGNRGGESETLIGQWLRSSGKRDQVVIATKVGKWDELPGLSPDNIETAVDQSLKRLGVDTIDLYQAHADDPSIPLEATLGAFARLIEKGKVRAIGASNYSGERLAEALEVAQAQGLPRYETLQPEYNLYDRAAYEQTLEPLAKAQSLGVINYYALASGFLTGKYRDPADASKSPRGEAAVRKYLNERGRRILAALDEVAAQQRAKPAQIALAWLMARDSITAPIASASSVEQLQEILRAAQLTLTPEQIQALDEASAP
ncbi:MULTISPECIES: aldo/keto reductase [Pseudoxanthomonas]|uniref:Aryl-alcohol dehydrogenase-like predicted oxidoreductase n=1 Tax=Pseudoxanthomonas winnipegensis TaxID=2480810 RepID=A0AAW8GJ02_9GAMM|nr:MULTISPECIES: aldo/keto reductase [Pseudoxanthomonas]MDQ1120961.1 aryl-alcohol dehydrogenase-like predicted oxidoreductase [Pseudoxanthomonas winnipegensis]MDQ1134189.1 aryl-alcohol dehydrogenase-like predicted oxidoreductase [Pseudoxanthomonas winnipegensis]MDR6139574.1 aryl-alcohol dehydrogenase-like predicted oxidoreductase [Pseudoxanthomonas sp. SORGH_AS_0997]